MSAIEIPTLIQCDDIDKTRDQLLGKIRTKMIAIIDEAEKRGMTRYRGYVTSVVYNSVELKVTMKDDTESKNGKTYFQAGDVYYISSFEGNGLSASQLFDAVQILSLVVAKFNKGADQDRIKIDLAEKVLAELKI